MEIKTKEYCERCPWFYHALGWLEPSNRYWQRNDVKCACEDCPSREECEINGPKDVIDCVADTIILRWKMDNNEATIKRKVRSFIEKRKREEGLLHL